MKRCAIVTGAGNGIGRGIATALAAAKVAVVAVDIDEAAARETVAEVERAGGEAAVYVADVSDPVATEAMVAFACERFGSMDILINNAALVQAGSFLDTGLKLWNEIMAVNLTGTFLCAQAAAKAMIRGRWGRIVNISSHSGILGTTGQAAYATSKGGVIALTRVMAVELSEYGITANSIAPGSIATQNLVKMPADRRATWESAIPLGRHGAVPEVAALAVYLASEDAGFLTGQTIAIDGGFTTAGLIVRKSNPAVS